jgi:Rrf2 family protein
MPAAAALRLAALFARWQRAAVTGGPRLRTIMPRMHLSARADYAVRGMVEIATARGQPVKREQIASAQQIPTKFLSNILQQLRAAGLVRTHRGADGGYLLTLDPDRITLADVIRAVDGPLANVRGEPPETVTYGGSAEPLREVWIAVRASLRNVLEQVTLQDVACNELPAVVRELAADPHAWQPAQLAPQRRGRTPRAVPNRG